tara:strand:+ start:259 stop:465 length:207 start_codon:yes stop_codon:yes gene_type:complete
MLNFNIDGNLNCESMCQKIDRYIKKVIQEKGQGRYILNIQVKEPVDEIINNKTNLVLPIDMSKFFPED